MGPLSHWASERIEIYVEFIIFFLAYSFTLSSPLSIYSSFVVRGDAKQRNHKRAIKRKKNEDLNSISSFISKFEDNWLRLCCNPIRSGTSLNFQQIIGGVLRAFFRLSQLNSENWPKAGKKSDSDLNELRWKRVHSSWHYSFLFSSLMSTVLSLGKKWKSQSKKFPSNIRRRRRRKEKLKLIQSLI